VSSIVGGASFSFPVKLTERPERIVEHRSLIGTQCRTSGCYRKSRLQLCHDVADCGALMARFPDIDAELLYAL